MKRRDKAPSITAYYLMESRLSYRDIATPVGVDFFTSYRTPDAKYYATVSTSRASPQRTRTTQRHAILPGCRSSHSGGSSLFLSFFHARVSAPFCHVCSSFASLYSRRNTERASERTNRRYYYYYTCYSRYSRARARSYIMYVHIP